MHPLYGRRNRLYRAHIGEVSSAAAGIKVSQSRRPGTGQPGAVQQQPVPNASRPEFRAADSAAQYSPLAAQGGDRGQKVTWYLRRCSAR